VTDLLLLVTVVFADQVRSLQLSDTVLSLPLSPTMAKMNYYSSFVQVLLVADGGVASWNNGLLWASDSGNTGAVTVDWLTVNLLIFLVYFALYGFLAQFIFRWLTLCQNRRISTAQYFGLLALIQLDPLATGAISSTVNFPPPDHRVLNDQAVADHLGLNATQIVFSSFVPYKVSSSSSFATSLSSSAGPIE
jgi:hypothetical protein